MNPFEKFRPTLQGKLLVSCQADDASPLRDSSTMARMAQAAVSGGAAGIRANGTEDVKAIRAAVNVPVIGIWKAQQADGEILITPTFDAARQLVDAGADMIALDCTARGERSGAFERLQRIKSELGVPVLADIATAAEAVRAAHAGADVVLSTLRGYTQDTRQITTFEPDFIAELVKAVRVPVIAEGRIQARSELRAALDAGAFAVIVGSAITRPETITRGFVSALKVRDDAHDTEGVVVGIDMGGTNTKFGLVGESGNLIFESTAPTPWRDGRDALLDHLREIAARCLHEAGRRGLNPRAIGLATAGWVNPHAGEVVYATENLPGWTGARVGAALREALGLPVVVENDANALAVGEKQFGAARHASDFVCITLGTGVGGGCYIGGRLNRGRHFFANGLGHIPIEAQGRACTCGLEGCLEQYTNAAALLRYADPSRYTSAEQVIAAARTGEPIARQAMRECAKYLAMGCATVVNLLDPELLILAGGLAHQNELLLQGLTEELARRVMVWPQRNLRIMLSALGYHAGVLGAAAVAREGMMKTD